MPLDLNFLRYSARDFVELFVTKTVLFPGQGVSYTSEVIVASWNLQTFGLEQVYRLFDTGKDVVTRPQDAFHKSSANVTVLALPTRRRIANLADLPSQSNRKV